MQVELAQNLAYRNMTISDFIQRLRKRRICGMDATLIILAKMWGVNIGVVTDHELWLSADVDCAEQVHILLGTNTAMTFYSIGISFFLCNIITNMLCFLYISYHKFS